MTCEGEARSAVSGSGLAHRLGCVSVCSELGRLLCVLQQREEGGVTLCGCAGRRTGKQPVRGRSGGFGHASP